MARVARTRDDEREYVEAVCETAGRLLVKIAGPMLAADRSEHSIIKSAFELAGAYVEKVQSMADTFNAAFPKE